MIKGNLEEVRKQVDKLSKEGKKVVVLGGSDDFNRKVLEMKKIDVLLSPEYKHERDMLKQRDSGLNHVLCKIAKKNDIIIGIDFNNLNKVVEKYAQRLKENILKNVDKDGGIENFYNTINFSSFYTYLAITVYVK